MEICGKELYNAESYNVDLHSFMFELFLTIFNVCSVHKCILSANYIK